MRIVAPALLMMVLTAAASGQAAKAAPAAPPDPKVKVGSHAPDFTLRDQNGKEVKLSEFRGKKNVVLAFYVFAFTGG
jgi:cytochrome oxidase Cu insertion factor (SCO1/SenC/PrrC family)